jgi:hypothetical protein
MYGRAEFDLLRLRVLHQSKKSQDRKHKDKNGQGLQADRLKKPRRMKNGTTSPDLAREDFHIRIVRMTDQDGEANSRQQRANRPGCERPCLSRAVFS